jgi:hypothetical protein
MVIGITWYYKCATIYPNIGETGVEIVCGAMKYATGIMSAIFIASSIWDWKFDYKY